MATSNPDFSEPIHYSKLRKGWHASPKEYDYWVPEVDIEGSIPRDLEGTLFRNGPGLLEVYGSELKHRKCNASTLFTCDILNCLNYYIKIHNDIYM